MVLCWISILKQSKLQKWFKAGHIKPQSLKNAAVFLLPGNKYRPALETEAGSKILLERRRSEADALPSQLVCFQLICSLRRRCRGGCWGWWGCRDGGAWSRWGAARGRRHDDGKLTVWNTHSSFRILSRWILWIIQTNICRYSRYFHSWQKKSSPSALTIPKAYLSELLP